MVTDNRITPEWVEALAENEIFVFGCRNSGRHFDGSGMRKFDRVETTSVERYSIVYKDNRCGLYDIQADSLVTAIKYDVLKYARTASEGGYEFTIWVSEMENYEGMISIESTTNEPMEIVFPRQQ